MRFQTAFAALVLAVAPATAQDAAAPDASPATQAAPESQAAPAVAQPVAPPPAQAPNGVSVDAVAALPVQIGDVQIVGPWVEGDRRGVWRTVMTQNVGEAAGNRFFLQQLEESDGRMSVASTTEVTEIGEIDGAVVGYRTDAPAEGQESALTLFFDIVPLDGEIADTYELFASPGQPYRFGPATN